MKIKYPLQEQDSDFEANAAFLMRARDVLNTRADPASGATIAFSAMVAASRSNAGCNSGGSAFAEAAYPWLKGEAARLSDWIGKRLRCMVYVLGIAILVSAYAAWGKVMLDTLDAVRADDGATQRALLEQIARDGRQAKGEGDQGNSREHGCAAPANNAGLADVCARAEDIRLRNEATHYNLAAWEFPLRWSWPSLSVEQPDPDKISIAVIEEQKKAEQWATGALTVLGNYILPIAYGYLGSLAFVLRRFHDRMAESRLSPRDLRANYIRLRLGALIGGCIGLVYSGSNVVQTTGTLGLAVTLSTSATAFLAGYGVEAVFKSLDWLISQVFGINGASKTPPRDGH